MRPSQPFSALLRRRRPVVSGAAGPLRTPFPGANFRFKAPYGPAIAFSCSATMFGISCERKSPISDCGAFLEGLPPELRPSIEVARPRPVFCRPEGFAFGAEGA